MSDLSEEQAKAVEKLKEIDPESEIFWDSGMKIPEFIKGTLSKPSTESPENIAKKFLEDFRELLDMQPELDENLELFNVETDFSGFHHVIFLQHIKGIPVFEGSVQVHINPAGELIAYRDFRIAEVHFSLEPKIKREEAIEIVLRDIGLENAGTIPSSRLMLFREHKKQLNLKKSPMKKLHLAWQIESIFAEGFAGMIHFIDAHTGKQLYKFSQIRSALLRKTYTAKNEVLLPGELLLENSQTSKDEVAMAAHENMGMVYDYFKNNFGRDSYDNRGSPLVSTVHFKRNYNNSFWSDYHRQLVFGDGDGFRWKPMAFALDIVAHELAHAVAAQAARFVYSEEAGALDESFADIFSVFISNKERITNWEIGEGVYTPFHPGDALRDISDPPRYGQPDHIDNYIRLAPGELPDLQKNQAGYIHLNSGIPNKAAYLTINGGTHYGIKVKGIPRTKAEKIYYLAFTAYLYSATLCRWTFREARYALLNACRQLYGEKGPEYTAIRNAWAAVGLGKPEGMEGLFLVEKEVSPGILIPDMYPEGVLSSIYIPEDGLVKDIRVSVNIEHSYLRDLRVILFTPAGKRIVLHDRLARKDRSLIRTYNPGSLPDLKACIGERVWGKWTLTVADLSKGNVGSFLSWGVKFLVQAVEKEEIKREVFPWLVIPDNNPSGIASQIEIERSGKIVELRLSLEISHPSTGDLKITLTMPSGEELVLHDRSGYGIHDLEKTFSTKSDELLLPVLSKEMRGVWILKVMDQAEGNEGSLDSWELNITYESDLEFL
ncbi:MAG TPA: hypothetical protein HA261_09160 [Methanosarcina sp.]|nr:hypothetical protein [Methanosarcina sp.]